MAINKLKVLVYTDWVIFHLLFFFNPLYYHIKIKVRLWLGEILILVARMLADSQELFIAIWNGNSFPWMPCVTSKEVAQADGEIVINRSINALFSSLSPLFSKITGVFLFYGKKTAPVMSSAHGSDLHENNHMMWS